MSTTYYFSLMNGQYLRMITIKLGAPFGHHVYNCADYAGIVP